jgi:hypothetical protein
MRLCQILRAPDAESGGSPFADELVTVTRAELDELKAMAERGHHSAPAADREDLAETWKSREAALSREIAAGERKAAELERAYKSALRDRELATALVGKSLVAGAASQLIKLWRDDFEVVDEAGEIRVLARDGRGVEQAVAERLAGPEFAHFCLPSSRGGTGVRGQNRSASPAPQPPGPRTLGEAVVMQWREAASRSEGPPSPPGWGRRR